LPNLFFKAIKGISCETGDAFFYERLHQTAIMPAEIFSPVISDLIDSTNDQKGNAMAKSHYQFKKRQKELEKKKKREEKRQRKLANKAVETDGTDETVETDETDETEKDPTPST